MSAPVSMPSLLAIAIVRRLLLELKMPEEEDLIHLLGHPAEIWVTRPIEELGGRTPAQALAAAGGHDVVRSWLEKRLG